MFDWLPLLGSIIFVDLVLSGDNALVIGAVASKMPDTLRWVAFLVGGGGAIVLRIALTYPITLLLHIPLLQAVGGILLLIITARLFHLKPDEDEEQPESNRLWPRIKASSRRGNFVLAMLTIIAADAMTSLDNIIAVAALAKDNQILLIVGLLLSITFLLLASILICNVIKRLPLLLLLAAGILVVTSAQLIVQDQTVKTILPQDQILFWQILAYVLSFICVVPSGYGWARVQLAHKA